MGIKNSDKDPNFMEKVSILVRPTWQFQDQECEIAPAKEGKDRNSSSSSELVEINAPSLVDTQSNGDDLKTPTSLEQKIPVMLKCPPAPRKPKSLPSAKRKEILRRTILLDLTKEIDSLFPPDVLADLGNKIKKVGQGSDFIKC